MSVGLIEAASVPRMKAKGLRSGFEKATPNQGRDARVMAATMDHSSIRALGSAFPHFFAGLPRSDTRPPPRREVRGGHSFGETRSNVSSILTYSTCLFQKQPVWLNSPPPRAKLFKEQPPRRRDLR